MIDTDKYEGLTIDDWYKMNHHDWKDVVNEHNDLLAEVKRLRSIADDLYAYIVSDAGISLKIIEEQMDWRDEE